MTISDAKERWGDEEVEPEGLPTCLQQTRLLIVDAKVALNIREDT